MRHLVLCIAALACVLAVAAGETCFITRVVDGDTVKVWDMDGLGYTVRLIGIDTPECRPNDKAVRLAEKWGVDIEDVLAAGEEAAEFVRAKLPRSTMVHIVVDGRGADEYGRVLAYLDLADGECLNTTLLEEGYAEVFRREDFTRRREFFALESRARADRVGFWATIWKNREK